MKFIDYLISFSLLSLLLVIILRITPMSYLVVRENFGLVLISIFSICFSTGISIKAGFTLSAGDLVGVVVN